MKCTTGHIVSADQHEAGFLEALRGAKCGAMLLKLLQTDKSSVYYFDKTLVVPSEVVNRITKCMAEESANKAEVQSLQVQLNLVMNTLQAHIMATTKPRGAELATPTAETAKQVDRFHVTPQSSSISSTPSAVARSLNVGNDEGDNTPSTVEVRVRITLFYLPRTLKTTDFVRRSLDQGQSIGDLKSNQASLQQVVTESPPASSPRSGSAPIFCSSFEVLPASPSAAASASTAEVHAPLAAEKPAPAAPAVSVARPNKYIEELRAKELRLKEMAARAEAEKKAVRISPIRFCLVSLLEFAFQRNPLLLFTSLPSTTSSFDRRISRSFSRRSRLST